MLRTAFLSLILCVSLSFSSSSILRKSISRRQSDPEYCQAIEGFDCKCTQFRVACTTDRDLPTSLNVLPNEKQKYQSIELVINAERDITVNDHTFEPVKQLYKPDGDNFEIRIKFEKFTALHLTSPGVFNRVYPDNLPSNARKHMALEIYNPLVQPNDNINLFQGLNVDSLELYVLYPFRGTFQQLFDGANIKYLRLSGGDIRSDLSQTFTGNIGRLELAKQAGQLSVQNFPVYPAHELVINAFYVTDFNSDHPPNYANLGELRIHSQERIPANAFRQFPNLHTLSISTEKEIDPHAFDGLHKLEKLTIKDTKPSLELLQSIPNVKEFEANIEKLDEREQCQLVEKLANGQIAVQAIPNGRDCTCVSAYLDTASGRFACDAQNCDQSSCAAIKNNYDASTRTFKAPPPIKRADGSDALQQRESKLYAAPFQIPQHDQEKVQKAVPQQPSGQEADGQQQQQQQEADGQQQQQQQKADGQQQQQQQEADGQQQQQQQEQQQQQQENATPAGQSKKSRRTKPRNPTTTPTYDQQQQAGEQGHEHQHDPSQQQTDHHYHPDPNTPAGETNPEGGAREDGDSPTPAIASENRQGGDEGNENRQEGEAGHENQTPQQTSQVNEVLADDGTENPPIASFKRRRIGWLPIALIVATIAGLLIAGLIVLLVRKRRIARGYSPTATDERGPPTATKT